MKKTLGGERLGSGKKMQVDLKTYERSTHDLSYLWRTTMSAGTLVPFMAEIGLPGDTFDIDLETDIKTHPTIGPLFGSYKVQLDIFKCDMRLYQGKLHNNALNIGLNMKTIKLPQIRVKADKPNYGQALDNQQINPSTILSYLNIRGVGIPATGQTELTREFNATAYLAYWDIYKNYYANKSEEIGAVIHAGTNEPIANYIDVYTYNDPDLLKLNQWGVGSPNVTEIKAGTLLTVYYTGTTIPDISSIRLVVNTVMVNSDTIFTTLQTGTDATGTYAQYSGIVAGNIGKLITFWDYPVGEDRVNGQPQVYTFPLENIDTMREDILAHSKQSSAFLITEETIEPYNLILKKATNGQRMQLCSQEGLAIKTYQSDLFNNWLSTEWLNGVDGINEITRLDTTQGYITIDAINLSKKVYDMLNRVAVSGGSYDDWLDTVWTHDRWTRAETPVYVGGLIKELGFQEVISNSAGGEDSPLGTLAGRGVLTNKHKGGKVVVRVDEPCYIIGIISITPRIDYSQGNKWDTNLKTLDDLHKPALDEIGFQDLITDAMAWFDTPHYGGGGTFRSAGLQPAWINYMTNVNQIRGNFAMPDNEMFMTLNRRYEFDPTLFGGIGGIKDLTTYIDPAKFNFIFAETARDAQNFWGQISLKIEARRKMSAKIIPNL